MTGSPVIGITAGRIHQSDGVARFSIMESYVRAVLMAGGAPFVIPLGLQPDQLGKLFSRLDGLLLSGGADIELSFFGGIPHPRVYGVDRQRDETEFYLYEQALAARKPVLGICRGIQIVNVAMGGTLFSDISDQKPDALHHDNHPGKFYDHLEHEVEIAAGSQLASILSVSRIKTNSMHHQGIDALATGLEASAFTSDGLIEAVEIKDHPFMIAVQWHPEWMTHVEPMPNLFHAFVSACQKE